MSRKVFFTDAQLACGPTQTHLHQERSEVVVKEGNVTISGPRFVQDSAQCVRVRRRKRFKPLFEPPISRAMAYDRTTGHVPAQGAPEAL